MFGKRSGPRSLQGGLDDRGRPRDPERALDETLVGPARGGPPARSVPPAEGPRRTVHAAPRTRLVDLAADWFGAVLAISRIPELPDPAAVRSGAQRMRSEFESAARAAGIGAEDIEAATYALGAYFDETVLSSTGASREEWLKRPLVQEWFGDARAGEGFFTRLDQLRRDRERRAEAIEVYYTCLLFGFLGRYRMSPPEKRAALVSEIARDLDTVLGTALPPLAPNWTRPQERAVETPTGLVWWWRWAAIGGGVFAGFLVILIWQWIAALLTSHAIG